MKLRGTEIIDAIERTFGPVMIVQWGRREYKAPDPPTPTGPPRVVPPTVKPRDRGLFDD